MAKDGTEVKVGGRIHTSIKQKVYIGLIRKEDSTEGRVDEVFVVKVIVVVSNSNL